MSLSSLRVGQRRSAILPTLIIVAILIVTFAIFTSVWTDRLWHGSFGYASVFSKMLLTRIALFLSFGLIMATCVVANAAIAYRLRPRLGAQAPSSPLLERYRELLESRFVWVLVAAGVVVGLFAGGAASGHVLEYLAWRNAQPFNVTDSQFGLDVGFFVFSYPWWRFVLSFAFAALVFSIIVAAIVHYTMGGLRFSGARRGGSRAAQAQLSILVGLAVVVKGLSYWFDQYQLAIERTNRLFTGISYTADKATVTAKMILAIIAAICALLFFANAALRRWMVPTIGLILMVLSAIVLGVVYPGAVQYFSVRPSEAVKERPYIERNIAATRAAYGVDGVEITGYSAKTTATAGQLQYDAEADVVVGVREMNLNGVPGQNWNNLKTVYTHGYGLVAAYGNRRQSGGE